MKDKTQYESLPISFEVKANGVPKPEAQWFINDKPIKADGTRVKIIDENGVYKLDIKEVKLEDEGTFKVVIKNKLGEKSATAKLSVTRKEKITYKYHNFQIN